MRTDINSNSEQPVSSGYKLIIADQREQKWIDIDRTYVIDSFRKHGAILFRGFSADLDDFTSMTDKFCNSYTPNPTSNRKYVSRENKIQTVDLGNQYFPLHLERSQTPFRADIAFFHCCIAPPSGGQTFFCDGELLATIFPESLRDQLMSRKLLYRSTPPVDSIMAFLEITDTEQLEQTLRERGLDHIYFFKAGKLVMNFMTPFLGETKFHRGLAFANFLLFSRFALNNMRFPVFGDGSEIPMSLCNMIAALAEPITTLVNWEPNDLLMIDNTRVMHGRMAIEDLEAREILTRFGYASFS